MKGLLPEDCWESRWSGGEGFQTVLSDRHSESVRFVRIERNVPRAGPVRDFGSFTRRGLSAEICGDKSQTQQGRRDRRGDGSRQKDH